MKVEYINPFILSTCNVFETMVNVTPEVGRPTLKTPSVQSTSYISGVIGLSGEVTGNVVVGFPKRIALKVVSAVLGMETKIIDDTVTDAIGELTNIIAGRAKEGLKGLKISISIPSVIVGVDHSVRRPTDVPCVSIPFVTEWGEFSVDVSMKESASQANLLGGEGTAKATGGAA